MGLSMGEGNEGMVVVKHIIDYEWEKVSKRMVTGC